MRMYRYRWFFSVFYDCLYQGWYIYYFYFKLRVTMLLQLIFPFCKICLKWLQLPFSNCQNLYTYINDVRLCTNGAVVSKDTIHWYQNNDIRVVSNHVSWTFRAYSFLTLTFVDKRLFTLISWRRI